MKKYAPGRRITDIAMTTYATSLWKKRFIVQDGGRGAHGSVVAGG